jgi:RsmE family RNA methyltransferase
MSAPTSQPADKPCHSFVGWLRTEDRDGFAPTMTVIQIHLLAMVTALQVRFRAHAWSSLRQLTTSPSSHHVKRGRFGQQASFATMRGASVAPNEGGGVPVLPKGDYHQLPRLYVGPEPEVYRIESPLTDPGADCNRTRVPVPGLGERVQLQLTEDQSHYLTAVLRLFKKKKADPFLRLFDGESGEWLARVVDCEESAADRDLASPLEETAGVVSKKRRHKQKHRNSLSVECVSLLRPQPTGAAGTADDDGRLRSQAWLCVAVPGSKDRFRWLLEKATELNVDYIVLLETEFSASSNEKLPISLKKALSYLLEASEQSERLTVPRLAHVPGRNAESTHDESDPSGLRTTKLVDLLDGMSSFPNWKLIVCRERMDSSVPFLSALREAQRGMTDSTAGNVAFCIGPEGGWSPSEESRMDELRTEHPDTVINASLGPTILRMETAAISVLSAYNLYCDDH